MNITGTILIAIGIPLIFAVIGAIMIVIGIILKVRSKSAAEKESFDNWLAALKENGILDQIPENVTLAVAMYKANPSERTLDYLRTVNPRAAQMIIYDEIPPMVLAKINAADRKKPSEQNASEREADAAPHTTVDGTYSASDGTADNDPSAVSDQWSNGPKVNYDAGRSSYEKSYEEAGSLIAKVVIERGGEAAYLRQAEVILSDIPGLQNRNETQLLSTYYYLRKRAKESGDPDDASAATAEIIYRILRDKNVSV